ncbi:MAG: hypothetical protein KJ905_01675 [Nanoarchaeota archaeon]|nr:hypothetical protein [Nanoarchaeota archaeon]MBU1501463.1 hypothetical protein [Nanoarchaeota archaeon]MBU2459349.1 hypothetical protein [Nanoarchaeota archaeon]
MNKKEGDFLLRGKKGQGLSTNAIILIILGVVVLVVLILGFTIGWAKLIPFVQTNNVQNIVTSCETACTTGAQFDWCSTIRSVNDGVNDKFDANCNQLSSDATYTARNYGVAACPTLSSKCAPTPSS